jgi:hypothetical protein
VSHEDRGPLLEAVDDIRTALAELEPNDDDLTSFVKMLLGFVQKYGEWECTTEKSYAKLLAQNPAGRASGTPRSNDTTQMCLNRINFNTANAIQFLCLALASIAVCMSGQSLQRRR